MTLTLRTLGLASASVALLLAPVSATAAGRHPRVPASAAFLAMLEEQVRLDRAGFSPGEIDGGGGPNTRRAQAAFGAAHRPTPRAPRRPGSTSSKASGTAAAVVSYVLTAADVAGPFVSPIPEDMTEKSELQGLYFSSVLESLAEKFHAAPSLITRLNPGIVFTAGQRIRVPNVSVEEGTAPDAAARRVVVSKRMASLTVYDRNDAVIFHAPVTSGSEHDSLPLGTWSVTAIVRNPTFNYSPDLFWDADPGTGKVTVPAGPNNPVGVAWIDINKPHYGLHGTPEPGRVGYAESHGCVRLTNWDVERLASLISRGTAVVFTE